MATSLAVCLYARRINLVSGADFWTYTLIVMFAVTFAFLGGIAVHKLALRSVGLGRHAIVATLPVSLVLYGLALLALMAAKNNELVHRIITGKATLVFTAILIVLASNLMAVLALRRAAARMRTGGPGRMVTVAFALAVATVMVFVLRPAGAAQGQSIVLVTVDSWRHDHRHSITSDVITPNIHELESESIVFENCQTHAPYTWTSLSSIMTSLESPLHGVRINGQKLGPENLTLAEVLGESGYRCFAATDIRIGTMGLDQGFESFSRPKEFALFAFYCFNMGLARAFPSFFGRLCFASNTSMSTTLRGLEFLRSHGSERFFLWFHYYDEPHAPYDSPQYYRDLYNRGKTSWVTDNISVVFALRGRPEHLHAIEGRSLGADDQEFLLNLYRAEIAAVDTQIGMVLGSLESSGLMNSVLFALTADHGEDFGERDQYLHGSNLYQGQLHVPLIIRLPRPIERETVPDLVRGIDIAPTIVRFAGAEPPSGFRGRNLLSGRGDPETGVSEWCFSETLTYGMEYPYDGFAFSYASERYKYISIPRENRIELYDVVADPQETVNVATLLPETVAEIEGEVLEYFGLDDVRELVPAEGILLGEEQLNMLKALGYID